MITRIKRMAIREYEFPVSNHFHNPFAKADNFPKFLMGYCLGGNKFCNINYTNSMPSWRQNFANSVSFRNCQQTANFETLIQKYSKLYQQFLINYLQLNKYELRLNEIAEKSGSTSPRGSNSSGLSSGNKKGAKSEGFKELEDKIFLLEKELRENLETKLQQSKQIMKLNETIKSLQTESLNNESSKKSLADENNKLKAITSELEYQNEKFQKKIKNKDVELEKALKELLELKKALEIKEQQENMQNIAKINEMNIIVTNNSSELSSSSSDDNLSSYFDLGLNTQTLKSYNSNNSSFFGNIPLKPHLEFIQPIDNNIKSVKLLTNHHRNNQNKLQFLVLNEKSILQLWEYSKTLQVPKLTLKQKIFCSGLLQDLTKMSVSQDGKLICVSNCETFTSNVYSRSLDPSNSKYMYLTSLSGHSKTVNCCNFSPDSQNIIATGSNDNTIKLFDINQYDSPYLMTIGGSSGACGSIPAAVNDLDIQKNLLLSGHADGSVVFHDLRSCECINSVSTHSGEVISVKFPNYSKNSHQKNQNNCCFSMAQDGLINMIDMRTFCSLGTFSDPSFDVSSGVGSTDFTISPCGRYVSAFGQQQNDKALLFIWDLMAKDKTGNATAILDLGFNMKTPALDWGTMISNFGEENNKSLNDECVIIAGGFDKKIVIIS